MEWATEAPPTDCIADTWAGRGGDGGRAPCGRARCVRNLLPTAARCREPVCSSCAELLASSKSYL
eukprot:scaffold11716_cov112-Isochrysis_galbana.AAC.4